MSSSEKKGLVLKSYDVEKEEVEKADGIDIQRLITDKDGSENIHMRKFTMKPGGSMVLHRHENTEHVQYVLKGNIKIKMGDKEYNVDKDDAVFIPKGVPHSYLNIGSTEAEFLCIIPSVDVQTEILDE